MSVSVSPGCSRRCAVSLDVLTLIVSMIKNASGSMTFEEVSFEPVSVCVVVSASENAVSSSHSP